MPISSSSIHCSVLALLGSFFSVRLSSAAGSSFPAPLFSRLYFLFPLFSNLFLFTSLTSQLSLFSQSPVLWLSSSHSSVFALLPHQSPLNRPWHLRYTAFPYVFFLFLFFSVLFLFTSLASQLCFNFQSPVSLVSSISQLARS